VLVLGVDLCLGLVLCQCSFCFLFRAGGEELRPKLEIVLAGFKLVEGKGKSV
jgi:hypothetical protein